MSDDLCLQITSIEFCHESVSHIVGLDVPVQDFSVHIFDYNPFINDGDGSSCFMYIDIYEMNRNWLKLFSVLLQGTVISLVVFLAAGQAQAADEAQQSGVFATVIYTEPINVRGGPSTVYYPVVGRVAPGDIFPALGVSPGREWVQIAYPQAPGGVGWLYAIYVSVEGGELQIVEPPPTATPIATTTINPTFAAAFVFHPTVTRVPTFTPPPPLEVPQFTDEVVTKPSGIALGWLAVGLLLLGVVGYLISLVIN
jgi:uncharacterized protein YraI